MYVTMYMREQIGMYVDSCCHLAAKASPIIAINHFELGHWERHKHETCRTYKYTSMCVCVCVCVHGDAKEDRVCVKKSLQRIKRQAGSCRRWIPSGSEAYARYFHVRHRHKIWLTLMRPCELVVCWGRRLWLTASGQLKIQFRYGALAHKYTFAKASGMQYVCSTHILQYIITNTHTHLRLQWMIGKYKRFRYC